MESSSGLRVFGFLNRVLSGLRSLSLPLLIVCLAAGSTLTARAETRAIALPSQYANYALNPATGDVVAVDADKGRAFLFRQASLSGKEAKPSAELRVGSKPVSVFYKEFGETKVYAVVCLADAHMYLINSGDFTLLKKVSLDESSVTQVTGSTNPEDPFLYYSYGSGHDSVAGAVSLRDFKNKGQAFDDSADCAISAAGDLAYRRGPWSPTGFESLIRVTKLTDDKPKFERLFYDHNSTSSYVPDPFGQFTASSANIYIPSLAKKVSSVDFLPKAFFKSEPILVGFGSGDSRSSSREPTETIVLKAASYNTFENTGETVILKFEALKDEDGRPVRSSRNRSVQVFADDARKQVVVTTHNKLFFVPLADFDPQEEPFLLGDMKGKRRVHLGEESRFEIVPKGEGLTLVMEDLPGGAKADGNTVVWTPEADDVGMHKIAVTFKHKDIERTQQFEFEVAFPNVSLPFAPSGISAAADGERLLIWEGAVRDQWGRVQEGTEVANPRIAVVKMESGEVIAERKLSSAIGGAVVTGDYAVLHGMPGSVPRCEILNLTDLERKESVVLSGDIAELVAVDSLLIARTKTAVEVFEMEPFKKIHSEELPRHHEAKQSLVSDHGLYLGGVLFGSDFKPKLIATSGQLPAISPQNGRPSFMPDGAEDARQNMSRTDRESLVGTHVLPGSQGQLGFYVKKKRTQVAGATHTWQTSEEIAVAATSKQQSVRQVLARGVSHSRVASGMEKGRLSWSVTGDTAYVVAGSNLYAWPWAERLSAGAGDEGLAWIPKQSALTLDPSGKTVLEHELNGGDDSTKISLLAPSDGMQLDEKTRSVTLDNSVILKKATEVAKTLISGANRGEPFADTLKRLLPVYKERASQLLGTEVKGMPVMIPVRLNASSADLDSHTLQYYVVAEISGDSVNTMLAELDTARAAAIAQRDAAKANPTAGREDSSRRVVFPPPPSGSNPAASTSDPAGASASATPVGAANDGHAQRLEALEAQNKELAKKNEELSGRLVALETRYEEAEKRTSSLAGRSAWLLPLAPVALLIGIVALVMPRTRKF